MDHGLTPSESILRKQSLLPAEIYEASWEIGRLVLAPEYRAGPEALKRCSFLTLMYMLHHREMKNLFASCTPVLARLYRPFGFSVLLKNASDAQLGPYALIHGPINSVMRGLSSNDVERQATEEALASLEQQRAKERDHGLLETTV